jgi:hypothetical protein
VAAQPLWRFGQCFGEKDADEEFSEADVLSAIEFDTTGNYLATGDKGGRIVVFERAGTSKVGATVPHPPSSNIAPWFLETACVVPHGCFHGLNCNGFWIQSMHVPAESLLAVAVDQCV